MSADAEIRRNAIYIREQVRAATKVPRAQCPVPGVTAGPWRAVSSFVVTDRRAADGTIETRGLRVAECNHQPWGFPAADANAQLMAAAPDLAGALDAVLQAFAMDLVRVSTAQQRALRLAWDALAAAGVPLEVEVQE